jgi:hypothetical protein
MFQKRCTEQRDGNEVSKKKKKEMNNDREENKEIGRARVVVQHQVIKSDAVAEWPTR